MKTGILKSIRHSLLIGALGAALFASAEVAFCQNATPAPVDQSVNKNSNGGIDLKLADKMVIWMAIGSIGSLIIYIVPGIFELRKFKKHH